MKTCPYCKFVSSTRKQHVAHLFSQHPAIHRKNLITCGTASSIPPAQPPTQPNRSGLSPPRVSQVGTPTITHPTSDYATILTHLEQRRPSAVPPTAQVESVRNGSNVRIGLTFTDGALFELVHLDYCPGYICLYPGPPPQSLSRSSISDGGPG